MTKMLFVEVSPASRGAGPVGGGRWYRGPARPATAGPAPRPAIRSAGDAAADTTSWSSAAATTGWWPPPTSAGPAGRCWCSSGWRQVGGAAVSRQVFDGVDVRLSAYSYLVSLLPDRIVADLGLELRLADRVGRLLHGRRRGTAGPAGLLVERDEGPATATSFRQLTGSDAEFAGWQRFYGRLADAGRGPRPDADRAAARRRRRSPAGCATPGSGTTCASGRWPTSSPTTSPTTSSAASP